MIVAVTKGANVQWDALTYDKLIYFTVTYVLPPCNEAAHFSNPVWGTDNSNTLDISYMIGDQLVSLPYLKFDNGGHSADCNLNIDWFNLDG